MTEIYTGELKGKRVAARLVILCSEDEETWEPVKPYNVPKWVQEEDVIRNLAKGMAVKENDAAKLWYAAMPVEDRGEVVEH